jgi:DNA-binding MarR family transcriptional regulator
VGSTDGDRARAWRLLFITMTNLLNTVESDLKGSDGLTLIDIGCLFALNSSESNVAPMGSLAALYAVDPSVITYRIKRLEERGMVVREVNPDNRRFTYAYITEDGRRLLRRARTRMLASADEHFFQHVGPTAPETLLDLLTPLLAVQQHRRHDISDPAQTRA